MFFWNRERSKKNDSDGSNIDLWPTATYWDMSKQAAGQSEKLKDCWDIACKELELENTRIYHLLVYTYIHFTFVK